ncbi:hypothetical protein D9758_018287 [Tetrapyrgos nigripes]|uniref:Uncharacterized protein n=1 Tax=Tetrapyrgos nigripes TaxID=182062 RepID=A0A8H5B9G2_9AGAR|nr:hypothetical protein D9758_018287 [Tetrapyrgos nigripes]
MSKAAYVCLDDNTVEPLQNITHAGKRWASIEPYRASILQDLITTTASTNPKDCQALDSSSPNASVSSTSSPKCFQHAPRPVPAKLCSPPSQPGVSAGRRRRHWRCSWPSLGNLLSIVTPNLVVLYEGILKHTPESSIPADRDYGSTLGWKRVTPYVNETSRPARP